MTHDIDLLVALSEADAEKLLEVFPDSDYYLSPHAVREAIEHRRMFNLLEMAIGRQGRFLDPDGAPVRYRHASPVRRLEVAWGFPLKVSTPEDTILAKLRWAKESGGSEKQFTDALRIYEIQHPLLDMDYLDDWAGRLDVVGSVGTVEVGSQSDLMRKE